MAGGEETVRVRIDLDGGRLELELYPSRAPLTVANFLQYVDAGHYSEKGRFYRVVRPDNQPHSAVKIDVVQGGLGLDAYDEHVPALLEGVPHEPTCTSNLQHLDGTLSMARLDPGTATSEVFVCVGEQPDLDFGGARNPDGQGFAAFGRVVEGMALVRNIQAGSANADPPSAEMEGLRGQLLDEPVLWRHVTRM